MPSRKNERKPCSVEGCEKPSVGRGWCRTHYSRWQRTGDVKPDVLVTPPGPDTCQVDNCGKPSVGRGMCRTHYMRWNRTGDPTMVRPHPRLGTGHQGCAVEGCDRPYLADGFCKLHYRRWKQHGDPLYEWVPPKGETHPLWKSDDIGYNLAHQRVNQAKGKATSHLCVDCGGQSVEWSYIGGDPDERVEIDRRGKRMPYSTKPAFYAPRCKSCHVRFDKRKR